LTAGESSSGFASQLGATSGLALSGSALAKADDFDCPSDACGTANLVGPFDFTSLNIPADDYSNIGSFILGPDGFPDATGHVITSGGEMPEVNGIATDFAGIANETLLYTDIGGDVVHIFLPCEMQWRPSTRDFSVPSMRIRNRPSMRNCTDRAASMRRLNGQAGSRKVPGVCGGLLKIDPCGSLILNHSPGGR
jgi:hypothetical protein